MRNDCLINFKYSRLIVASIAAEQFVCALTRKYNLYILACKSWYKVKRNTRRVGKRLVHMILHGRNCVPEFFAWNKVCMMLNTDFLTKTLCPADFVVMLAKIKAYRKGFLVCKICWNIAWVNTAWKETTNLNISDFVGIYRIFKYLFNWVDSLFLGKLFIRIKTSLPIACSFHFAVFVPKVVTRHKAEYTLKESFGRNSVLIWKVGIECSFVKPLNKLRVLKNTLDFTRIYKFAVNHCVVHRLNAKEVTGNKNGLILCIINSKAEHSSEL